LDPCDIASVAKLVTLGNEESIAIAKRICVLNVLLFSAVQSRKARAVGIVANVELYKAVGRLSIGQRPRVYDSVSMVGDLHYLKSLYQVIVADRSVRYAGSGVCFCRNAKAADYNSWQSRNKLCWIHFEGNEFNLWTESVCDVGSGKKCFRLRALPSCLSVDSAILALH
jgi:hypothetical protein